jgi:hypothetical protein
MLRSYQLLVLIKIILFQLLGLMCIEDDLFRRYRRLRSSSDSNTPPGTSFIIVTSVSIDDYQAVLNCSTPKRVSHDKLDWYFRAHSSNLPRVIWQRGRSNIHRYTAFSPDQYQHYLRIKPINFSDSGFYTCLDQTSGFYDEIELFVRDRRSCAGSVIRLQMTNLVCLVLLSSLLSRRTASESQVT